MNGCRLSVCMATYNGAAHLRPQLDSVLAQLGPDDELVVVDDCSTDGTLELLTEYDDPRVNVHAQPRNRGYVRAFEAALGLARGEVLVLADQDDVWLPGRLNALLRASQEHDVVASNLSTLGGPDAIRGPYGQRDWHLRERASRHALRNVLGVLAGNRPYFGCAMAVRRDALGTVLPFPDFLNESHDLWIALYGNLAHSLAHVPARTVARRYHEANASPERPRGPVQVLRSRAMLVRCVVELVVRRRAWRRPTAPPRA